MKFIHRLSVLVCLVLLFGLSAFATAIPVTGTIQLPDGSRMNGQVRFILSYSAARDTSNNNITVASTVRFPVQNGTLPSSAVIVPNDVLQPANTWYTVQYIDPYGGLMAQNTFVVQNGASFDLGSATPTPVTTSNLSFSSFIGLSNVSTMRLNNVRFCDQFAGATAGAKIAACIADLPSSGGIADAEGMTGAQTVDVNIGISAKPVEIRFGAGTYTLTTAQTFSAQTKIVCVGRNQTFLSYTPTTGVAMTFNDGFSHQSSVSGISHCTLEGPGSGTSTGTGVLFGGTTGAVSTLLDDVLISGFGTGYSWGNNAFGQWCRHCTIVNNALNVYMPSGLTGTGITVGFDHCLFGDTRGAYIPQTVKFSLNGSEIHMNDVEFDATSLAMTDGTAVLVNPHFEDVGEAAALPFLVVSGGYLSMTQPIFETAVSTSTKLIQLSGGTLVTVSGSFFNGGSAMAALVSLSGAANVSMHAVDSLAGFTNFFSGTTSGYARFDFNSTAGSVVGTTAAGGPAVAFYRDLTNKGHIGINSNGLATDSLELVNGAYTVIESRPSDGLAYFPQSALVQGSLGLNAAGSHITTSAANTDTTGTLTFSAQSTKSYTFATAFNFTPTCVFSPNFNLATNDAWESVSTTTITINTSVNQSGVFSFHCFGAPN